MSNCIAKLFRLKIWVLYVLHYKLQDFHMQMLICDAFTMLNDFFCGVKPGYAPYIA